MTNEQIARNYNMTDAELTVFAHHVIDSMESDISLFAPYAVLPATVTSLQTLCTAFENFPTDTTINQQYQEATELKDELMEEMRGIVRSMVLRVEFIWGKKSNQYASFKISDMAKVSDEIFLSRIRIIYAFMEEHKTELAVEGLTDEILEDFAAKIEAVSQAKYAQIEFSSQRAEKTTQRIENGNQLYKLVSKYCEIGKRIWDGVNPSKYNDYVIYDDFVAGSLTAPTDLTVDVNSMTFSWSDVENSTSFQLEIAGPGGTDWQVIYSGPENFVQYVPETIGLKMYRSRCRNSGGYSEYGEVMYYNYVGLNSPVNLNLTVVNPEAGGIELSWDEVTQGGVSYYSVYISSVPVGAAAGDYSNAGHFTDNFFSATFGTGTRKYLYVVSENSLAGSTSENSAVVFADL